MDNFLNCVKLIIAAIGAFLSAKLGILLPVLVVLVIAMVVDYISGMIAGGKEGKLNSKKGITGILKKVGYVLIIVVAMMLDWLILNIAGQLGFAIPVTTLFGLLVTIWFILNEILSIIENLGRFGVPLPPFLKKAVSAIKIKVEDIGEKQLDVKAVVEEVKQHE